MSKFSNFMFWLGLVAAVTVLFFAAFGYTTWMVAAIWFAIGDVGQSIASYLEANYPQTDENSHDN